MGLNKYNVFTLPLPPPNHPCIGGGCKVKTFKDLKEVVH